MPLLRGPRLALFARAPAPAAGETLGSELWPQPAFDADTGFTSISANWSIAAGVATSNGNSGSIRIDGILTIGQTYKAVLTVVTYTSGHVLIGWDGVSAAEEELLAVGTYTYYFVAESTDIYLWSSIFNGSVDNYSIKQVL